MENRETDEDRHQDADRSTAEVRETALQTRLKAELERTWPGPERAGHPAGV